MLRWSMTATSPGRSRLTKCFVRVPSRAVPSIGASGREDPPRRLSRAGRRRRLAVATNGDWATRRSAGKGFLALGSGSGGREQLPRVFGRRLVATLAAEHAADLLDHRLTVEAFDRRQRLARGDVLLEAEMSIGQRGDLR